MKYRAEIPTYKLFTSARTLISRLYEEDALCHYFPLIWRHLMKIKKEISEKKPPAATTTAE